MGEWTCFICKNKVVEGQRFTFIPGKGAVHVECLNKKVLSSPTPDKVAILDANEVLLYTIVRLKEAEKSAESDDIKKVLSSIRKSVEKSAVDLAKIMEKWI
ncbi:MAG: DUF2175 domain-containing protein [Desulfurococcales archaeon]|nr:DUF2175 domain-containing protein [Desulfurococcales archaeon]